MRVCSQSFCSSWHVRTTAADLHQNTVCEPVSHFKRAILINILFCVTEQRGSCWEYTALLENSVTADSRLDCIVYHPHSLLLHLSLRLPVTKFSVVACVVHTAHYHSVFRNRICSLVWGVSSCRFHLLISLISPLTSVSSCWHLELSQPGRTDGKPNQGREVQLHHAPNFT